jgi:GST-like protein
MIDLYTWATPNGRKVSILLEELGVPYTAHPTNVLPGNPKPSWFLKIAPNGKIPAIVDGDLALTETGAIMIYLADKFGGFLSQETHQRAKTIEWVMWQMSALGPMQGQAFQHTVAHPGKAPAAEEWILAEVDRLYRVLDTQLSDRDYIAENYSIADIACWTWVARSDWARIDLTDYPNIQSWFSRIHSREAVKRGYDVPHKAHVIYS